MWIRLFSFSESQWRQELSNLKLLKHFCVGLYIDYKTILKIKLEIKIVKLLFYDFFCSFQSWQSQSPFTFIVWKRAVWTFSVFSLPHKQIKLKYNSHSFIVVFCIAVATGNLLDIDDYASAVAENVDNHIEANNNNHNTRWVRSSPGQMYCTCFHNVFLWLAYESQIDENYWPLRCVWKQCWVTFSFL